MAQTFPPEPMGDQERSDRAAGWIEAAIWDLMRAGEQLAGREGGPLVEALVAQAARLAERVRRDVSLSARVPTPGPAGLPAPTPTAGA